LTQKSRQLVKKFSKLSDLSFGLKSPWTPKLTYTFYPFS